MLEIHESAYLISWSALVTRHWFLCSELVVGAN